MNFKKVCQGFAKKDKPCRFLHVLETEGNAITEYSPALFGRIVETITIGSGKTLDSPFLGRAKVTISLCVHCLVLREVESTVWHFYDRPCAYHNTD